MARSCGVSPLEVLLLLLSLVGGVAFQTPSPLQLFVGCGNILGEKGYDGKSGFRGNIETDNSNQHKKSETAGHQSPGRETSSAIAPCKGRAVESTAGQAKRAGHYTHAAKRGKERGNKTVVTTELPGKPQSAQAQKRRDKKTRRSKGTSRLCHLVFGNTTSWSAKAEV